MNLFPILVNFIYLFFINSYFEVRKHIIHFVSKLKKKKFILIKNQKMTVKSCKKIVKKKI